MSNHTKTCKICRKIIDELAKKCPYCHHWQNKILMSLYHPMIAVVPVVLAVFFLSFSFNAMFSPGTPFTEHVENIEITSTKLEFGENDCGKGEGIIIIGSINNKTDHVWHNPRFEIIFYNENEDIIDTNQDEVYGLLIPAKSAIPFKVVFTKHFDDNRYKNYKITIMDAKAKVGIF